MKIFITGITGFVGSACANHFSLLGHAVSGIGRKPSLPSHVSSGCHYTRADICQPLRGIEADVVIHAAAFASDSATFKQAHQVNVEGTKNVIEAAKNVTHFIYISSSSVYDFSDGKPKKEADAGIHFNSLSSYGKTKWLAEEAVKEANHFTKKTILRPRAIYGKYDGVLLPRLLRLIKGNYLLLPAHLSKRISLTHVSNLLQAIDVCINKQQLSEAMFNVADKEVYDLYTVLTTLLPAVVAKPLRVLTVPSGLFEFSVKANEVLHISPALSRFAAYSLTQNAVLDIGSISTAFNYSPAADFYNNYQEIVNWIHDEQGWIRYFAKPPKRKDFV